jgi:hypothetical protein
MKSCTIGKQNSIGGNDGKYVCGFMRHNAGLGFTGRAVITYVTNTVTNGRRGYVDECSFGQIN